MRVGVLLMPTDPWDVTVADARRLEALGYHHLWVYDHLSWRRYQDRPWHATYPWLAGLAASTSRIRLGTMVSNLNIRHPVVLAKDAMTLDHISGGRITLGLGAGGTGFDATALGQRELSPSERVDRLAEAVPLLDRLLRGDTADHSGPYFAAVEPRVLPGCVQRPRLPLAVAAGGDRTLRIAAAHADAWITYGDTTSRDRSAAGTEQVVAEQAHRLDEYCQELGREPADLDRIYLIGNTDERPLRSIEAFHDFVERYARLGFTDIVFHMPRTDDPVWNDAVGIVDEIAQHMLST